MHPALISNNPFPSPLICFFRPPVQNLGQVDTRAKPSALAEREFNKSQLLEEAASWQEVLAQFNQLGDNAARCGGPPAAFP
jgi:hypothetical protein